MIQTILALTIVGLAVGKTVYSLYKSITTKEKGVCGGCASCDLKNELKKKGKLGTNAQITKPTTVFFANGELKYVPKG